MVRERLTPQHQGELSGLLEGGQLAADPVLFWHVLSRLQGGLGHLHGQHVTSILGRVGIRLDALDHEGEVATGQAKELPDQAKPLDACLGPLLQVQRVPNRRVFQVNVPVALGGLREQGHQGVLAEVREQGLRLALRGGADVQPDRRNVGRPMGERRPRGNRRQP